MILMYHKISPEVKSMWWVSPDAFYLQMLDLQSKKVVYLDDYDPSDPSQCVITFDGVYQNVWEYGAPILKHFGYPFELFIVGDQIGKGNEFDNIEPPAKFADMTTLSKFVEVGGRLQWHTWTHPVLTGAQTEETYQRELVVPEFIHSLCPKGFKWFAFPHGKRDRTLIEKVKKNYSGALACDDGTPNDQFDLPRLTVVESTRLPSTTVSVVIPCYNYGHLVAEAIESVLLQTYPPEEILFIDDASTDNSVEVARRYEPRIRVVVNPKNLGIVENFKKAVRMTTGDYICFLGADNRFRGDYVEQCKIVLDKHPEIGVVYTHFALFGNKASVEAARTGAEPHLRSDEIFIRKFPANPVDKIRKRNYIHGSSMYRRVAYDQAGGYQQSHLPEDSSLFARILDHGWKAQLWDAPSLEYRQHSKDQLNFLKGYETENAYLRSRVREMSGALLAIQKETESPEWYFFKRAVSFGQRFFPQGSKREKLLRNSLRAFKILVQEGPRNLARRVKDRVSSNLQKKNEKIDDEVPRVSIIIPVFNALSFTSACIESLYSVQSKVSFETIIVNNHSTDGTRKWLGKAATKHEGLKVIHLANNVGFAGAVNKGVMHCRGQFVVILNNDTLLSDHWLDFLVGAFEHSHNIGIISPMTNYLGEGPQIDLAAASLPPKQPDINSYASSIAHRTELSYEPNRLVFFCVMIRRQLFDLVGMLDEGYIKGNYEDDDYCLRARLHGFQLGIAQNSFVYHHGSATFKKNRISHQHYMLANREQFYRKASRLALSISPLLPPRVQRNVVDVEVVLRTRNRPEKLEKALQSLVNQTYRKFGLVLINDGGEDISALLKKFTPYFPIEYHWNKESKGRTPALNQALERCNARWIAFLDDDDIYYPWHLESMVLFATKTNAKFAYGDYNNSLFLNLKRTNPDKLVTPPPWDFDRRKLLIQNHIPIHTWLMSRDCIDWVGLFDESLDRLEDYEYLVRLSRLFNFNHLRKVTCEYRYYLDSSNSIYTDRSKVIDAILHIYEKHPVDDPNIVFERQVVVEGLKQQVVEIKKLLAQSSDQEKVLREIVRMVVTV